MTLNLQVSTSHSMEPTLLQPALAMNQLARALENSDKIILVDVPHFDGKLESEAYYDWVTSLEAFFE